jgi:regulator of protease activity HflC (stomatin/prohibitin superfamily)
MEAENKRKADIQKYINETLTPWLKKQHEGASSVELCDKVLATINEKWPGADKFMEFTDYATGVKNTYVDLIKMKRQQLADADNMSDEQKQLIAEKEQIAKDKQLLLEREASIAKKEAEIAAEKARKEAELKAKEEAEKLLKEQEANKMSGTRKIWKFELVDKSKLLPEWISVDGDAVKAYMKDNKDKIKSGDVINGIKFYQDISISS